MLTRDELKDEVLDVLTEAIGAMSATAISKEVGYTKLSPRVYDILAELVDDDEVDKYEGSKGYDVYQRIEVDAEADDDYEEEDDEIEDSGDIEDNNLLPQEITIRKIPEDDHDYEIEAIAKGHTLITFPEVDEDGNEKTTILEPNEQLVVINQNPAFRFVVSSPDEVMEAINVFTTEQGISTYLVTDTSTGKSISDAGELDGDVVVIFLNIQRHDKAGN